jgi:SpoVK/Ycf46/Vps4 family AAA+-type ATPase
LLVEKILPAGADEDAIVPYQFSWNCKIVIREKQPTHDTTLPTSPLEFDFGTLKGMKKELEKLAVLLNSNPQDPVLIVGPSGTGKTSILEALSDIKCATFQITASTISSSGSKIRTALSAIFSEARETLPAMILIDDLDILVPVDAPSALASALSQEIRNKSNGNVRIVASAKRQLDIHQHFSWAFPYLIELPVPTAVARKEILRGYCESASDELLDFVSTRTHAFVPGDIWRLYHAARQAALWRCHNAHPQTAGISSNSRPQLPILEEDFAVALRSIRPSAMGEILLDVPDVRWSDIGGSEHLKAELQRATRFLFEVSHRAPFYGY